MIRRICSKLPLSLFVLNLCLAGCSNSSDSSSNDSQNTTKPAATTSGPVFPQITVTQLSFTDYFEYEPVTLTLNAQGDNLSNVTYNWTLGQDIAFTGQGTDTIKFMAPAVDAATRVSVQVDIDVKEGTLAGSGTRQTSSFRVLDRDSPTIDIVSEGLSTELPSVPALDYFSVTGKGLWLLKTYEPNVASEADEETEAEPGEAVALQRVTQRSAVLQGDGSGGLSESVCHTDEVQEFDLAAQMDVLGLPECASPISYRFYQSDLAFRREAWCEDEVLASANLIKVGDEQASMGSVALEFDNYPDYSAEQDLCVVKVDVVGTRYQEQADGYKIPVSESVTSMVVSVPYVNDALSLWFTLDAIPTGVLSSYSFGEAAGPGDLSQVILQASDLPQFVAPQFANQGSISVFSNLDDRLELDGNLTFTDAAGNREQISLDVVLDYLD